MKPFLEQRRFDRQSQELIEYYQATELEWNPPSESEGATMPRMFVRGIGVLFGDDALGRREADVGRFLAGKSRDFPLTYVVAEKLGAKLSAETADNPVRTPETFAESQPANDNNVTDREVLLSEGDEPANDNASGAGENNCQTRKVS